MAGRVDIGRAAEVSSRGVLNLLWGVAATMLCVLYTLILAPSAALFAASGRITAVDWLTKIWAGLIIRTCGVRVDIRGIENLHGVANCVIVANHQSFFDIFASIACLPGDVRFVAKKELLKIPVIGYTLRRVGHVIVDRQAGGKSIRNATEVARRGYHIVVFAEGHRYSDNRVHEFNDGGAWLAIMTRLPAVPMAISGTGSFFPREARVVIPGRTMRMTICPPVPTDGMKSADRTALTRRLEEAVRAAFVEEV